MSVRLRFGVMATPQNASQWIATARRVEQLGFSTLVTPDGMQLPSPFPALAIAAGATTRLRVGTFVLAAPLRRPGLAAWDAHSLSLLSGHRFDLGIGTGRPDAVEQAATRLGEPAGTTAQRLQRVVRTLEELRALDGAHHTPVLMAVGGPRAANAAAQHADIITIAAPPLTPRDEVAAQIETVRAAAGRPVQLAMNVFAVGDATPPWLERSIGTSVKDLRAQDSLAWLPGDPEPMRAELERRVSELGLSYTIVNGAFMDAVAPLIAEFHDSHTSSPATAPPANAPDRPL
jgi:alkanesulfonate monooxygenase SsuD/methylene tetrahydromethanopterin reductase-like flavin-dependent oxidoreductase (luciferase family)